MKKLSLLIIIGISLLIFNACKKDQTEEEVEPVTSLFFSPEDDVALGGQLKQEILNNPQDFPLLDSASNPVAYEYLYDRVNEILNSGKISYKDEFKWEARIVLDDNTLNAFAAPGGYIYFYTGLIKYLDKEDDFMGVLGHEIAHADRRHSIKQMEKQQGIAFLISLATGDNSSGVKDMLAGLAGNLATLKFSRNDEIEADEFSVNYLSTTPHRCDGAATFFKKLEASGQTKGPVFLSTHPSPSDRVENIQMKAEELSCDTTYFAPIRYEDFRNLLP